MAQRAPAPPPPREILAVQIVPAQRLGVPDPPKPKPTPAQPPQREIPVEAPPEQPKEPAKPALDPKTNSKPAPVAPAPPSQTKSDEPPAETAPLGSEHGLPGGMAASGTTMSGIDDPDFTYGYYLDQMLQLIRSQWTRPPVGPNVECVVKFVVDRDGRLTSLTLLQPSGISSFDLSAQRAVQSASPLPPLPRGYRGESLGVTLVVR